MTSPVLLDYQETGRDFLEDATAALLGDQPGLGKTGQAISAARDLYHSGRFNLASGHALKVCVVCPRTAIQNWFREWDKWWPGSRGKQVALFVVNYDRIALDTREKTFFETTNWDLIIADEAHRLKSPGAKRSQNFYRNVIKWRKARKDLRVWLLTGTPSRNHAGELWTHLAALRPDLIEDRSGRPMTIEQFEDRYCRVFHDQHGHRRVAGSRNMKELRGILEESGFFLRRMKKDVQSELPDLIFDDYPLQISENELPYKVPTMPELRIQEGETIDEILDRMRQQAKNLSSERRMTGLLKVPFVAEAVEDELDAPGKALVFFWHKDVGQHLMERLSPFEPALVQGGTNDPMAQVDRFQNDPDCRVFLGQITACGEALNLTAARAVFFAEASWSPSDNYQAACRAHRIGMGDNLVVRFLSVAGTVDEIIQRVLARKTAELTELFG